MATFIMLTRLSPDAAESPQQVEQLEQQVMDKIRSDLPEVNWLHNFATLGPYDYVDIFEAPDIDTATRVSTLVRIYGHATSEIWPATEWQRFKDLLHEMPEAA